MSIDVSLTISPIRDQDGAVVGISAIARDITRYRRTEGGTGLGLALVAGLVDLHHGSVTIDSTEGRGTTVTVTFPPASAEAVAAKRPVVAAA